MPKSPVPAPAPPTKAPITPTQNPSVQVSLAEPELSLPLQHAFANTAALNPRQVLQLQRTMGNRAVTQLLGKQLGPSRGERSSLPHSTSTPPLQRLTHRAPPTINTNLVVQRVIMGLEAVATVADIADAWVTAYINDITDLHTHLYDEDIIAYLDQVRPNWHGQGEEEVVLRNTGGNHWDVTFISRAPARRVVVRTAPDGNCAIHAIHAILRGERFAANTENYHAPVGMILPVRRAIQARMRNLRAEVKVRILLQIQRAESVVATGFGPQLRALLGAREEAAIREVVKGGPSSASALPVDNTPPERIRVELDVTTRFERLVKENVPLKTIEAIMVQEKVAPDTVRAFLASHAPARSPSPSVSSDSAASSIAPVSKPVEAATPKAPPSAAKISPSASASSSSGVVSAPAKPKAPPAAVAKAPVSASASSSSGVVSAPAKPKADPIAVKRDDVRQQVLTLEGELMDLVDFEVREQQFLRDMRTALQVHHQPKLDALGQAKIRVENAKAQGGDTVAAEAEVTTLTAEWEKLQAEIGVRLRRFEAVSQRAVARHQKSLPGLITEKRKRWMALMAELTGTHVPGGGQSWSGLVTRHDARPGGYGRTPTAEDARIAHRQVEVLHGHGGWERTGLVSEGLTNPAMRGLTSLGEILERANAIRRTKKMMEIPADKLDLAFVDHHGSTIMMDKVMRGAYPDLMAMPLAMHKRVVALMEEAVKVSADTDEYIKARCSKMVSAHNLKPKAKASGASRTPRARAGRSGAPKGGAKKVLTWTDLPLWNAYQQVKSGTAGGKPATYVDILSAATHGGVPFPDSRLGHLHALDQGEKAMKAGAVPGYRISTVMDLSFKKTDDLDTATVDANTVSARLSDAIVERLSQIAVDERPIRIIWAGCRSEQWRKGFSDEEFLAWIRQAAAARSKIAPSS